MKYEVLNVDQNPALKKCSINVILEDQADENQLVDIAEAIRSEAMGFERLYIFFYIPGYKINEGAWATGHYLPDLRVDFPKMQD